MYDDVTFFTKIVSLTPPPTPKNIHSCPSQFLRYHNLTTMMIMKRGEQSFLRLVLLSCCSLIPSCIIGVGVQAFSNVVLTKPKNFFSLSSVIAYGSLHIYDPTGKEEKDEENGVRAPKKTPTYFPGSGQHVLVGNKYVIKDDGTAPQVSSGKSTIYQARPMADTSRSSSSDGGQHSSDQAPADVVVKLSPNIEAIQRELENYELITSNAERDDLFVKVHDYVRVANPTYMDEQAALVMERGEQDLQQYIRQHGPLRGRQLQEAMRSVAECVQAVHATKMLFL